MLSLVDSKLLCSPLQLKGVTFSDQVTKIMSGQRWSLVFCPI